MSGERAPYDGEQQAVLCSECGHLTESHLHRDGGMFCVAQVGGSDGQRSEGEFPSDCGCPGSENAKVRALAERAVAALRDHLFDAGGSCWLCEYIARSPEHPDGCLAEEAMADAKKLGIGTDGD